MYGKDNALVTNDYREPPDPDPESSVTGVLYESNPTDAAYVVVQPGAWMFRGRASRRAPGSPAWSASSTTGSTPTTRCSGRSRSWPTRR